MKNLTIGIPTFNGAKRVEDCLKSIYKWNDRPAGYDVRIVILDDGSRIDCVNRMLSLAKEYDVRCILHEGNKGIPKSWNDLTLSYFDTDIMVLLNDDILVSRDWLTAMVYFLENNPQAGAVGWNFYFIIDMDVKRILKTNYPVAIPRDPVTKIIDRNFKPSETPGKMMCAVGCCFAMTIDKFKMFGGFDERIKSFHEESLAFTILTSKGYPSYQIPYPMLYHCYDDKTELLTENGFKYFSEINYLDKIATLNPETNELEYYSPKSIIKQFYRGNMVEIDTKSVSLSVTPDHNMYVSFEQKPNPQFSFLKAVDLLGKNSVTFKKGAIWSGTDEEFVYIEEEQAIASESKYNGYVYCVTVPNHIIYVRRKGKMVWCGNCWGKTFSDNEAELKPNIRMMESRKIYCDHFNVPDKYAMNPFEYTDPLFMNKIKPSKVKYLDKNLNEQEIEI